MKIHYLYRHIRKDKNEPFYIGIGTVGKNDININREESYYRRAYNIKNRNKVWKGITNKSTFHIEILFECNDYEFIKNKEIELIALYGRKDLNKGPLANLTNGGDGLIGRIVSQETRKKMSERMKNHIFSEETKLKFSKIRKGIKRTQETKDKISKANTGKKRTKEQCEQFSIAHKGLKLTEEHKKNISNSCKQKIKVIDTATGIIYDSIAEASIFFNIPKSTLSGYLKNRYPNKTNLIYL